MRADRKPHLRKLRYALNVKDAAFCAIDSSSLLTRRPRIGRRAETTGCIGHARCPSGWKGEVTFRSKAEVAASFDHRTRESRKAPQSRHDLVVQADWFARRARSGHPAASGAKIFVTQTWRAQPDFLSRFNKSTQRANHPKVCKAPVAKIF